MNRHTFTTCLLLPVMLAYLSGAAQVIHERFDHHGLAIHTHDHHAHDHHEDQDDHFPLSQPDDFDDCSICFALSHIAASTIDLTSSSPMPQTVTPFTETSAGCVVACRFTHLPPGRGPPHANL